MAFYDGEKVFIRPDAKNVAKKWRGRSVEIIQAHYEHNPCLYSCKHHKSGKELALYETELESVWEHDMRQLAQKP